MRIQEGIDVVPYGDPETGVQEGEDYICVNCAGHLPEITAEEIEAYNEAWAQTHEQEMAAMAIEFQAMPAPADASYYEDEEIVTDDDIPY
jgi:hypothetical protein